MRPVRLRSRHASMRTCLLWRECLCRSSLTCATSPDSSDSHTLVHINSVIHTHMHTCGTQLWLMFASSQEPSGQLQCETIICSFAASIRLFLSLHPSPPFSCWPRMSRPTLAPTSSTFSALYLSLPLSSTSLPLFLARFPFGIVVSCSVNLLTVSWPTQTHTHTHLLVPLFIFTSSSPFLFL